MPWDFVAFMLLATICVICAGGVVASANPVHSGIFLGICFIHVAGIFVMLGAEFLAVVQVIVYTQALGRSLYTEYLLPFEIASLVLTVGIIGAIVLAMPERLGERIRRRQGTISLGHPRGTDLVLPEGVRGESPIPDSASELATGLPSRREVILVGNARDYTTVGRGQ
jgi:hypothetical protein